MRVLRGFDALDRARFKRPTVTIGVYDGMHLGHRAVLESTRDLARDLKGDSVVVTFDVHPRLVVKGQGPRMICSVPHRLVLLARAGIDCTVLLPFDDTIREMTAGDFADRVFESGIGAKGLVLGFDSRFGKDREGGLEFLREWAADKDILVRSAPPVLREGRPISSSVIRDAIERGHHDLAQSMLGRPVAVYGTIVTGSGRGREIGYPTANLDLQGELCPPRGVYAAWARLAGRWRPALVNIGGRPTFEGDTGQTLVEVHVPGVERSLYGEELEVQFIHRIRDEKRFSGVEALVEQIRKDAEELTRIVEEVRGPDL
jgi:riboflavin kinase/FMN adenylyltransferase